MKFSYLESPKVILLCFDLKLARCELRVVKEASHVMGC